MSGDGAETMLGLSEREYKYQASLHSKLAMALWLVGGLVYIGCYGRLVSLASVVLFLPGIFAASLLAMVGFVVHLRLTRTVDALEAARSDAAAWVVTAIGLAWWVGTMLVLPVYLAIVYVRLFDHLVGR